MQLKTPLESMTREVFYYDSLFYTPGIAANASASFSTSSACSF